MDPAAVPPDDFMGEVKAETRALPDRLCREKGVEDLLQGSGGDSNPVSRHSIVTVSVARCRVVSVIRPFPSGSAWRAFRMMLIRTCPRLAKFPSTGERALVVCLHDLHRKVLDSGCGAP